MGVLGRLVRIIVFGVVLISSITFLPGIPPTNLKFEAFEPTPALKLEGKLAPNSILNNVQIIKVDKALDGPESVAVRGDEIYFGDKSGRILKIKNGKMTTVAELSFPCGHLGRPTCSYPLGTRFDPKTGKLFFTDAYGGLLQVDVDTGKVKTLVARHEYVEGAPIGFPEDLDITKDGTIYWSDGSSTGTIEKMWPEALGHPTGRLLKYEPSKNKTTVLLNNIHFANGVQLSANEDFIVVGESVTCQVKRYYLKGPKKGQNDIFVSGLPGIPDNIRSNGKGGFYVTLFHPRIETGLEGNPLARKFLARSLYLFDYVTTRLYNIFPSEFTKWLNQLILLATEVGHDVPGSNGFVVELNEKGEIIRSLQSTNRALHGISQVTVGEKFTYFASPGDVKIWYIETKDLN